MLRVIGSRQRKEGASLPVVDGQIALNEEKELRKLQLWLRDRQRSVLDGAYDVSAVR